MECDVNQATDKGCTPLIVACYVGHYLVVKALLESKNELNFSALVEDKNAIDFCAADARVPAWEFIEETIDIEGRRMCLEAIRTNMIKKKNHITQLSYS